MIERDSRSLARGYYRDLDGGDYDGLAARLTADFRHVRGDMTLEGREAFVRFMRDERPSPGTTHEVDGWYRRPTGDGHDDASLLVRGRVLDGGETLVRFVDAFTLATGRIERLETYTQ